MKSNLLLFAIVLFIASCAKEQINIEKKAKTFEAQIEARMMKGPTDKVQVQFTARRSNSVRSKMVAINDALLAQGLNIQLDAVEAYSADGAENTVYFNNRGNKQLSSDWVPFDPRRGGFGDIAYAQDGTEAATASGLAADETIETIDKAMGTWDNITCSEGLEIFNLGVAPFDIGYVQFLVGAGGLDGVIFDVVHGGFSTALIDAVFGPGSNVLAVTFTFVFIDGPGSPTDIDGNGKSDAAFREIYYNDVYPWSTDGPGIDLETVALHEVGHALSQAHFGKLFQTGANEKFHFAPRALMNAGYTGVQRSIKKTDLAGHCSNWSEWPAE